ncbi:hypothetical protein MBCUT_06480 [Methanobrevibacter cuticularis]|uniref:Uncharacterized protein n=1 Tax=Methanobrevibacter cuticularis TaxID=47311 RepID=A0A166EFZ4_9EURY|nr:hypothetical protein [Methanobrevibacter cuticularis]KZX16610.1 hypothetical protein MBCUT_06480 [Methanobrevibacter cuticularis]
MKVLGNEKVISSQKSVKDLDEIISENNLLKQENIKLKEEKEYILNKFSSYVDSVENSLNDIKLEKSSKTNFKSETTISNEGVVANE